jgi:competence protein ComEA
MIDEMGELRGRAPILAGLVLAAVAVGAFMGRGEPAIPTSTAPAAMVPVSTVSETLVVHVSGMVLSPGVVHVPAGAIVADVVAAAGGLITGASVDHINLAAPVSSGEHIVVPGADDGAASPPGAVGAGDTGGPVSLNNATAAELEALPGVGPVLAERIVAFRTQNGPFDVVEDLLEVSGIGEAKLAALRDVVVP